MGIEPDVDNIRVMEQLPNKSIQLIINYNNNNRGRLSSTGLFVCQNCLMIPIFIYLHLNFNVRTLIFLTKSSMT